MMDMNKELDMFTWTEKFDVGVDLINDQHKKLIDLINTLSTKMLEGKSSDVLGEVLKEIVSYGIYHFDTEEELFDKYGYEFTSEHKTEHASFKKTVTNLVEEYDDGSYRVSIDTLQFLKDWITIHILQTDMKYKDFLSSKI